LKAEAIDMPVDFEIRKLIRGQTTSMRIGLACGNSINKHLLQKKDNTNWRTGWAGRMCFQIKT